jgi:hypothetical protein
MALGEAVLGPHPWRSAWVRVMGGVTYRSSPSSWRKKSLHVSRNILQTLPNAAQRRRWMAQWLSPRQLPWCSSYHMLMCFPTLAILKTI